MHSIGVGYSIRPGYKTQTVTPGEGVRSKWGLHAAGLCVPSPQPVAVTTTEVTQPRQSTLQGVDGGREVLWPPAQAMEGRAHRVLVWSFPDRERSCSPL